MRDDGLRELRRERESKLTRLKQELAEINAQIEEGIPDRDEENSKRYLKTFKFLIQRNYFFGKKGSCSGARKYLR